ncbi:unnamed protein product, partial [Scytosiphon promiscuus]
LAPCSTPVARPRPCHNLCKLGVQSMDFSPDTPTAGYERYVSESESTDGEGDVSGGQQRIPRTLTAHETSREGKHGNHAGHRHAVASSLHHGKGLSSTTSSSSGPAPSILSRLAASWKKGSNSAAAGSGKGSTATLNGITNHHGNSGHRVDAPAIIGGAGGGTLWRDMQEGSPRSIGRGDGAGQGFDGGSRSTTVAAGVGGVRDALAAGISSVGKSSSGLKGLKTSLLTEDSDAVLPTTTAAAAAAATAATSFRKDGQQSGREGVDGSGGGAPEGSGRGLWDEAAAGDVSALAAALSEGGGGDVHACNTDGWTALHSAAHAGQGSAVMCLLVGRGASPAAVTRRGFTPLHTACMRGRLDAARALAPRCTLRARPGRRSASRSSCGHRRPRTYPTKTEGRRCTLPASTARPSAFGDSLPPGRPTSPPTPGAATPPRWRDSSTARGPCGSSRPPL